MLYPVNTPRKHGGLIEEIGLRFLLSFVTVGIVLVLASLVAGQVYTDLVPADDDRGQAIRPDVPGTDDVMLAKHKHHCWRFDAMGETVDSVLIRINPNDRFIHTRKPRLVARAMDQTLNDHDRDIDVVLAFCTDNPTRKGR